jgi:hypothetical protein
VQPTAQPTWTPRRHLGRGKWLEGQRTRRLSRTRLISVERSRFCTNSLRQLSQPGSFTTSGHAAGLGEPHVLQIA